MKFYPDYSLSELDLSILVMIANGLTGQEIAMATHYSLGTIREHIKQVRYRWHANNAPHLISIAYQQGVLVVTEDGEVNEAP